MQEETRNQEEKKNELEIKKNFKNQMPLKINKNQELIKQEEEKYEEVCKTQNIKQKILMKNLFMYLVQ